MMMMKVEIIVLRLTDGEELREGGRGERGRGEREQTDR